MDRPHRLGEPVGGRRLSLLSRLVPVVGVVVLVAALWLGGKALVHREPTPGKGQIAEGSESNPTVEATPPLRGEHRIEQTNARQVAPGSIDGPAASGELERVAPRPPLTQKPLRKEPPKETAAAPEPPPDPGAWKETLLYRPVADAAGAITAGGYHITIADIETVTADAACPKDSGGTWPCGVVARTEFRAWLHGRAVMCKVPPKPDAVTTHCALKGDDVASWLVENGWAKSSAAQYGDAVGKAEHDRRGMFGEPPVSYVAAPAPPEPPEPPALSDEQSTAPDGVDGAPEDNTGADTGAQQFPPPPPPPPASQAPE